MDVLTEFAGPLRSSCALEQGSGSRLECLLARFAQKSLFPVLLATEPDNLDTVAVWAKPTILKALSFYLFRNLDWRRLEYLLLPRTDLLGQLWTHLSEQCLPVVRRQRH